MRRGTLIAISSRLFHLMPLSLTLWLRASRASKQGQLHPSSQKLAALESGRTPPAALIGLGVCAVVRKV